MARNGPKWVDKRPPAVIYLAVNVNFGLLLFLVPPRPLFKGR